MGNGNSSTLACCNDNSVLHDSPLFKKATRSVDPHHLETKKEIDRVNYLSALDQYILKIKTNKEYLTSLKDRFGTIDRFIEQMEPDEGKVTISVLQSHTYHGK